MAMPGEGAAGGPRILVVDGHEDTRDLLETLLQTYGFETRATGNAAVAINLARVWRPAAVLVELELPVVSGAELVRAMRMLESARRTSIVACTSYAHRGWFADAVLAGCDDVMLKPIDPPVLISRLNALLSAAQTPLRRAG